MLISLLFHGRFSPYGHRAPCAEGLQINVVRSTSIMLPKAVCHSWCDSIAPSHRLQMGMKLPGVFQTINFHHLLTNANLILITLIPPMLPALWRFLRNRNGRGVSYLRWGRKGNEKAARELLSIFQRQK